MKNNFLNIKKLLYPVSGGKEIIAVNSCIYGKDNSPYKISGTNPNLNYYKICGQAFWELISGDDHLYKKIVHTLGIEAKKHNEVLSDLYTKKMNEMVKDIVKLFYTKSSFDWDKIIDYISKTGPYSI